MPKLVPDGVACHFTRLPYTEISDRGISDMLAGLEAAARFLAGGANSVEADMLALAHATASSTKPGADREIIDRIRKVSGVPATTILTAVVEALKHLNVKKVSAVLPYTKAERSLQLKTFLEANNIQVVNMNGGPYVAGHEVSSQLPSSAYRLLKEADAPNAEALVMTIPNFRTAEILDRLEADIGKPVVTGNQALAWTCLRTLGIREPMEGLGRLMRSG